MPDDYQNLVLATYRKMRDADELRSILSGETTARLRKACLKVYDSRYKEQDADILAEFFDVDKMECDFRQIIFDTEADDFKTLLNHIQKGTTTDEKNSNFLAWLIDFKPRPRMQYYKEIREKEKVIEKVDQPEGKPFTVTDSPPPIIESRIPVFTLFIASLIVLVLGSGTFIYWENTPSSIRMPNADEKCMYWTGEHYEPVNCNTNGVSAPVIALNATLLKHLRKINIPDTLTKYSLGKVWYSGTGQNKEYFTAAGMHPVDTIKRLRPLSEYITTKYNSNYRYLITRLLWFICAAFFIALCAVCMRRIKLKKMDYFGIREVFFKSSRTKTS